MKKKILSIVALVLTGFGLVACGMNNPDNNSGNIELKLFSNVPDRNTGRGKIEEDLIKAYQEKNPNIKITVESLPDEQYKQKLSAYANSSEMPDVINQWSTQPSYKKMIETGKLVALDKSKFSSHKFFPGALESFEIDDKLYGVPYTNDFMVLYYNEKLFNDNNIKIPHTYKEFLETIDRFREKAISPVAVSGLSPYMFTMMFNEIYLKLGGTQEQLYSVLNKEVAISDDLLFAQAVERFKELIDKGIFQEGFLSAEYGVAQNLFMQGQAAMYYAGSWDASMDGESSQTTEEFKKNVHAMSLPISDTGDNNYLTGWYGGGYVVNEKSKNKEEALNFLEFLMSRDNYTKLGWETNSFVPAMEYEEYFTGEETNLQKDLTTVLNEAKDISGTPMNDYLSSKFKDSSETLFQNFVSGGMSTSELLLDLQKAIDNQ